MLARAHDLTTYDAAYLACADDGNLELVTSDTPKYKAAQALGLAATFVG